MKAAEAKIISKKRTDKIARAEELRRQEKSEKEKLHAIKDREDFIEDFNSIIEDKIANAIEKGKFFCEIFAGSTEKSPEDAKRWFTNCGYQDEIDKILKKYKRNGYKIYEIVKTDRRYDLSDLNPRDDYNVYEAYWKLDWS